MDPARIQAQLEEVVQLQLTGRIFEADRVLRAIVEAAPHHADAWHLRGVLALQHGQFARAVEHLQQAILCNPRIADFHYNLAGAYYSLSRWVEAIAAYARASELNPHFFEAQKGRAAALAQLGRTSEAITALRQALAIDSGHPDAHLQLADWLGALGDTEYAIESVLQALKLEPWEPEAHRRLVSLFRRRGDMRNLEMAYYNLGAAEQRAQHGPQAIEALKAALELNPQHPKAAHLLAALTGETPPSAPPEYVIDLFNQYADHFDEHLQQLDYRVPERLREWFGRLVPAGRKVGRVLDLGCGSGRCGVLFRDLATELHGLDLAPNMIEAAHRHRAYDALRVGDLLTELRQALTSYSVILAADVFIYVGDLSEVFPAVHRACDAGGSFGFSVESCDGPGFVLRESGRFAHSTDYVETLAARHGFDVAVKESIPIRLQEGKPIPGWIYVLRRG